MFGQHWTHTHTHIVYAIQEEGYPFFRGFEGDLVGGITDTFLSNDSSQISVCVRANPMHQYLTRNLVLPDVGATHYL